MSEQEPLLQERPLRLVVGQVVRLQPRGWQVKRATQSGMDSHVVDRNSASGRVARLLGTAAWPR